MQIPNRFVVHQKTFKKQLNFQEKLIEIIKQTDNQDLKSKQIEEGSDIAILESQTNENQFLYEQNFRIIQQMEISKKTLNSSYQQRYFVLTPIRLMYFTNQNKIQLKGCFNFVSLLKYNIILQHKHCEIRLKVLPNNHQEIFINRNILQLEFKDEDSANRWTKQLETIIKRLQYKNFMSKPPLYQYFPEIKIQTLIEMNQKISNLNFWNRLDISMFELNSYCSHLDILLLRSKNTAAYVSRFFMRSYYDHVALILKSQLHQIYIFQATEARGVCLMDLETFFDIYKDIYEEIGLRKLIVQQTQEENAEGLYKGVNLQRLQIYLNSLIGKSYELSLFKLLVDQTDFSPKRSNIERDSSMFGNIQTTTEGNKKKSQMKQSKIEKTYFCSQLIADIYLKFGILETGKAKDFWPKDFEQNQLKFKEKCRFSPVMNVCF